jgi:hypothetical protein
MDLLSRKPGCSRFRLPKNPELRHGVLTGAIDRALIQAAADPERYVELAIVFHLHAMIDFDIIALDQASRSIEL